MDKTDYDTKMEALLVDRDTYHPVDKSPFSKIEKDSNNRLLDLKRQNKIDELTYRKLRSTDGSPPVVQLNTTNRASLFGRLFLPLAPPFTIHPSSFRKSYRRYRTTVDILFSIPHSSLKKWLIWKSLMMKLWSHLTLCRFSQLFQSTKPVNTFGAN